MTQEQLEKRRKYYREYKKKHRAKNLERFQKYQREWMRQYRQKNKLETKIAAAKYYQENKEAFRQRYLDSKS